MIVSLILHLAECALSQRLKQARVLRLTLFLLLLRARARVCQKSGIQHRYWQPHLCSSCISSSRSALRIHDEMPATIELSAPSGKYELHLARWFFFFPLFYFYDGSVSPVDRPYSKTNLSHCCPRFAFPMCVWSSLRLFRSLLIIFKRNLWTEKVAHTSKTIKI